ncbi:TIGR01777 family oxidoreductase [Kutzneria sp. NPDC051319]|uniref:TIGR01777 family oxidoreductase n=1 Tax=Kutzneria sp. NPDC051319 TaxID=3155047 RepID=UPI003443A487
MKVAITGSSGLIGTALRESYEGDGHTVVRLPRQVDRSQVDGVDVVVNLAGAGIGARRWTRSYRDVILRSRVDTTSSLVTAIGEARRPPKALLSASGVSYYGDRGDEVLTESSPGGMGFLPSVVRAWEAAAVAEIPVCHLRFGLVLSASGGVLGRMLPFFRAGLGARFGSGRQFWSWISLVDAVRAIRHLPGAQGPYNVTAPEPVRNSEFTRALALAVGRPAVLRVPAWSLRLALGGVAGDALESIRARPTRLIEAGFRFEHREVSRDVLTG